MAGKKNRKRKLLRRIAVLLIVLIVLFLVLSFLTPSSSETTATSERGESIPGLELPSPIPGEAIINHTGYTLSYNEEYELPSWVAYELTRDEVLGDAAERDDNFRQDPLVPTGSASLQDYRGSGYDRGHMAAAADFKWSGEAMSDTFYLSNMAPQAPSFNRGIWADLEAVARTAAYNNGSIYITTGPVLTDGPYETIGENEVAVPKRFYKVFLDYTEPEYKAIGFVLPNEGSDNSLQSFAISVDDVERITGLDFYPALPDDIEAEVESSFNTSDWSFTPFVPTGERPQGDFDYVSPDNTENMVMEMIIETFVDLKETVFRYLGIEDLARKLSLM